MNLGLGLGSSLNLGNVIGTRMTRIGRIMADLLYKDISDRVLRAFYTVYNTLGYGFLEKVYEKAMLIELNAMNLYCECQKPVKVYYSDRQVGDYYADIVVEGKVIIELKAAEALVEANERQLLNYLKATDIELGLLLNFGKEPVFIRKVFTNSIKNP
jgi:GxxExxY protein